MPISKQLYERMRARIRTLVRMGREICPQFKPDDMNLRCKECGYTADIHLIRDILDEFEAEG